MNIRVAHESPLACYDLVDSLTDYSYFLVHLFYENEKYLEKFNNRTRPCILDNSIFELGTAWPQEQFAEWVQKLKDGDEYIIPDVLEDAQGTMRSLERWNTNFVKSGVLANKNVKSIGVVQGRTYEEFVECYQFVAARVDKVAISFDYSYYLESTKDIQWDVDVSNWAPRLRNKWERFMIGRQNLITRMVLDKVIVSHKPHHLLGMALPQEGLFYKQAGYNFIDSVDTSNPVVHGIEGKLYNYGWKRSQRGLAEKYPVKLIEYMNSELTVEQKHDIAYNIVEFRKLWN